jgi:hypothetical protein
MSAVKRASPIRLVLTREKAVAGSKRKKSSVYTNVHRSGGGIRKR